MLFSPEDTKMASYRRHIKEKKGYSAENKIKAMMEIPLKIPVKGKVTDEEDYKGFQILPLGDNKHQQLFLQVELMGLGDGHNGNRVTLCNDYCSDDSDMSFSE